MLFSKLRKFLLPATLLVIIIGVIYYFNLSNRHKAIVKTSLLHFLNLIDSKWKITNSKNTHTLESPSFLIDGIYKSMEGPKAYDYFSIGNGGEELIWLTGFKVVAKSAKNNTILSNDFICHMNIDYINQEHYGRWNLLNRIDNQYPRLISISHGIEETYFPEGYGYPIFQDEKVFVNTQSLNHNVTDSIFQIKHDISINYLNQAKNIKPLMPKTVFMMLPFKTDSSNNYDADKIENSCVPMETKNHTYYDTYGQALSGHWKIFPGEQTFKYNATRHLALKDTLRLHKIVPHLHPFAMQLVFRDNTTNTIIYECKVNNHNNKIGLSSTPDFTSIEGINLYPEHDYEMILKTNNTTKTEQDMMASMFMFFYDEEMDFKIKKYLDAN